MSLKIIKSGLLDTVQDSGRHGYQHLGINPGGGMDLFSAGLANALLGKDENAATIEMHFPAASILFEEATVICITGAHFSPHINGIPFHLNQPIVVGNNSLLTFKQWKNGARCYLAIIDDLDIALWLNSYSTNLKAKAGGWQGRNLQTGDVIKFKRKLKHFASPAHAFTVLPWKIDLKAENKTIIHFIRGSEWDWLSAEAKSRFTSGVFTVSKNSDRMGYRLEGESIGLNTSSQLISASVSFGTVQVLPNGQLIVLMADHQTTGGYPKAAHVISTHLPILAQMRPGQAFTFVETDLETAEQELLDQKKYLRNLKNACSFNIEKLTHASM